MSQNPSPTICLTFDFDALSVWLGSFGIDTPTAMSRGEFGARVAAPRIVRLLKREQIKATFFIPGHTVDSFPEICAQIRDAGHEIGHHGLVTAGLDGFVRAAALEAPRAVRVNAVSPPWGFGDPEQARHGRHRRTTSVSRRTSVCARRGDAGDGAGDRARRGRGRVTSRGG